MAWPESQVQAVNAPPPKTWADYRQGCLSTYAGGHDEPAEYRAFQHGMETVFNLLEAEFPPAELCKQAADLIAKLPKTADGVPVVPGMTLWDPVWIDRPFGVHGLQVFCPNASRSEWICNDGEIDPGQCYSTREAAAKQAQIAKEPTSSDTP